jgi:hypothetical protein
MIPFVIAISCLSLVFAVFLARHVIQRDASATVSALPSSRCSRSSAVEFIRRRRMSELIWSVKSKLEFQKTTRATPPSSPTSSATTWATALVVAQICLNRRPRKISAP